MVRLETHRRSRKKELFSEFTFQYGQIRNEMEKHSLGAIQKIYIPVWLDQKRNSERLK